MPTNITNATNINDGRDAFDLSRVNFRSVTSDGVLIQALLRTPERITTFEFQHPGGGFNLPGGGSKHPWGRLGCTLQKMRMVVRWAWHCTMDAITFFTCVPSTISVQLFPFNYFRSNISVHIFPLF
jgi:hypothetical protein